MGGHESLGEEHAGGGGCKQITKGRFLRCPQACSDGVPHHTWVDGLGWELTPLPLGHSI